MLVLNLLMFINFELNQIFYLKLYCNVIARFLLEAFRTFKNYPYCNYIVLKIYEIVRKPGRL